MIQPHELWQADAPIHGDGQLQVERKETGCDWLPLMVEVGSVRLGPAPVEAWTGGTEHCSLLPFQELVLPRNRVSES